MSYRSALALVLTIGCLGRALALGCASSEAADQPSATVVAIAGATTMYRSQDRHGTVVTVQVPSQSTTDLKGADAQGNVHATVTAIDRTRNQVKVQTPAGQETGHWRRCPLDRRQCLPYACAAPAVS